jgi:hypothetical protein
MNLRGSIKGGQFLYFCHSLSSCYITYADVKASLNIPMKGNAHFIGSFTSAELGPGYDLHTFGTEPALSMPNYDTEH